MSIFLYLSLSLFFTFDDILLFSSDNACFSTLLIGIHVILSKMIKWLLMQILQNFWFNIINKETNNGTYVFVICYV
jgi:hypothetical protein